MKLWIILLFLSGSAVYAQSLETEHFERKIRPILLKHCVECHSSQLDNPMGGFRVDSKIALLSGGVSGPAIVPKQADESLLIKALRYKDPLLKMPPSGKLPDRVIRDFEIWISNGAHDPRSDKPNPSKNPKKLTGPGTPIAEGRKWWAFQPLVELEPPDYNQKNWPQRKIDAFVLAKLQENSLEPSPNADPRTLIRRASLDLTGLPPSYKEIEDFVSNPSPNAYKELIERLLASPRYGERWGRHWLDVARWAEDHPTNESTNQPHEFAWRYRDWVIEAFNKDIPYDQFIRMQFAADLLPDFKPADMRALGYIGNAPMYHKDPRLSRDVIETLASDDWDERVDAVSRGLLGLTVACARCHDHKFDPITNEDYYGLAGVFASQWLVRRPIVDINPKVAEKLIWDFERLYRLKGQYRLLKTLSTVAEEVHPQIKAMKTDFEALEKLLAENKIPLTHAVIDCGVWIDGSTPTVTWIDLHPDKSRDLPVFIGGNVSNPGKVVPRRFLTVFSEGLTPIPFKKGSGRLDLANKIVGVAGPLASRVLINRVWGWHFGEHLVRTPSDFGAQGQKPTHPQLLDDLAARFVKNGWSLKWLHREIMLSATYRQASRPIKSAKQADPTNQWLWRKSPGRLNVEAWRDTILQASGELKFNMGGPSENIDLKHSTRRSVYSKISRSLLHPLLQLYDFPVATQHKPKRQVTTTPLQQLFVLNSKWMQIRAKQLAERIAHLENSTAKITTLYRMTLARNPKASEIDLALKFLKNPDLNQNRRPWEEYAQVLLGSSELAYLD